MLFTFFQLSRATDNPPSQAVGAALSGWEWCPHHKVSISFYFWCTLMLQLSQRQSSHITTFSQGGVLSCPLALGETFHLGPSQLSSWVELFLELRFHSGVGLGDKNSRTDQWNWCLCQPSLATHQQKSSAPACPASLWVCVAWQPAFPLSAGVHALKWCVCPKYDSMVLQEPLGAAGFTGSVGRCLTCMCFSLVNKPPASFPNCNQVFWMINNALQPHKQTQYAHWQQETSLLKMMYVN